MERRRQVFAELGRDHSAIHVGKHPRVIIWSDPTIPDRTDALLGVGPDPTDSMIRGALALAASGATVLAVPCNTAHAFAPAAAHAAGIPDRSG